TRARERGNRSSDSLFSAGPTPAPGSWIVSGGRAGVSGTHKVPRILAVCAVLAALVAPAVPTADAGPSSPEEAVFASPAPGSAVALLSEVIKEKKLDERNGLLLEVKYFDPAATEQAVILRRVDAGIFPVVSAARVNLVGEKIRLFAPALINHNSVVLQKGSTATRLADLKGKRIGT